MNLIRFRVPALALLLGVACLSTAKALPAPANGQDRWDAPPAEWNDIQQRGFHDGLEGAHKDFDNHRRPDVNNRDEYKNPDVKGELKDVYREGYRRGYERAVSHFWGANEGPRRDPDAEQRGPDAQMRGPEPGPWDAAPPEFSEAKRQGFRDGVEGARKDFDNHRRPDPNNRDEYRKPHVEHELRGEYREGFRHGYEVAMAHLAGGPDRR